MNHDLSISSTATSSTQVSLHFAMLQKFRRGWGDAVFAAVVRMAAVFSSLLLLGILISLFISAAPAIKEFGLPFFLWTNE